MDGYNKLLSMDKEDQDAHSGSENGSHHECAACSSHERNLVPWIWCGICSLVSIMAVLSSMMLLLREPRERSISSYPTDFISSPKIPHVEKYLYNYYDFNPTTHLLEFNMTGIEKLYSGPPSKEIDNAWGELLQGTYMVMDKDEEEAIQKAAPWELEKFDGKVYAEVSVFHNLHCLDLIRRALDPDYYDIHTDFTRLVTEEFKRVHVYHCVDQLRQALQCQSDMTPVPLFSCNMLKEKFYATHSVAHTCRDFNAVKDWVKERNEKNPPFNWSTWTG